MISLHRRLLAGLLSGLAALWLAVGTAVYLTVRTTLEGRFDAELRAMASEVRHLFSEGGGPDARPAGLWLDFYQLDSGSYFEVWDEFLLFSDRSPNLGEQGLPQPESFDETPQIWNFTRPGGEPVRGLARSFVLPADAPDGQALRLNIVVARNRAALDRAHGLLLAASGGVGLLLVPLAVLLVRLALGYGLRPLRAFAARVEGLGLDSLAGRLETASLPRELRTVADRLNELLDRLAAGLERERRLNADLAHELRTPVAELRTMAEVALAWPEQISAAQYREVLSAATQMQVLIDSMLLLARWDRQSEQPPLGPVEAGELLRRAWAAHAAAAAERGLRVEWAAPDDLVLTSNADLLHIVVSNLFANAVAHSPEGGRVRIEAGGPAGRFQLTVANAAPHVSPEDLPHLFERFWRRDAARSGGRHAGLGLALAGTCAGHLGLDLTAELDATSGEIIFRLRERSPDTAGQIT